jgi:hypothetical protein
MLNNFIPEFWAKVLMTQRPEETVFAKLCSKEYSGEIEKLGDRVRITGIGRPTRRAYTKGLTLTSEYMSDYTQELIIDKAYYFDVLLDDVDKKQIAASVMPTIMQEGRRTLAEGMDTDIGLLYAQAGTSVTETGVTSQNIIEVVSDGITALYEQNVPTNEPLNLVVTPAVANKIMIADIIFNTDNSATLSNGWMGRMKKFINTTVYMSNNVYSPSTVDYCMLFTNKALALAEQIPYGSVETYRDPDTFADGVKALHLYGCKVIRPKELVCLNLTTTSEE